MMHQEVIYNLTGQSFFYDPPEGRPTGTPTLAVYLSTNDDDGATESAAGACTVDSVNTTFTASAGATSFTVASATGITRLRRYLVTDVDGDREWVEVLAVTGTTVTIRQPLRNSYAASSTFVGCRISAPVDSTWVATSAKITDVLGSTWNTSQQADAWMPGAAGYRLRWSYTVGSATIGVSFADLIRYQAKNLVTPLDVDRRFPGWIDRLPVDYIEDQGQSLIDEAFQAMRLDALGDQQLVRRIRDTQVLRELTIYRANVVTQEASIFAGVGSPQALELAEKRYERRYKQLIREPKVLVDNGGGGAGSEPRRLPAFRR